MNDKKKTNSEPASQKLAAVRHELNRAFPERRDMIDGALTALLAGEHILILGPPGTAKSLFARTLSEAVAAGSYFEWLLTKFSTMEDIFGPVSFSGLKNDKYERILDGKAASSQIVFLDEIWKSSSSILNANLTLMQERVFHNGSTPTKTPLKMLIAASNEYPQDESLAALYDRFAIKFWVDYISDADVLAGLLERGGIIPIETAMTESDLVALRKLVCDMPFSNGSIKSLLKVKEAVTADGFLASDRTWIKATKLIKARAVLDGRSAINTSDYMVLADMLWKEHKDRPNLKRLVGNAADPYGSRAEAIVDGVKAAMKELPSIDILKSGQKTKVEMINIISKVSGQVGSERDKILEVESESGGSNSSIIEARETVEAALAKVDSLMQEVTWYRQQAKIETTKSK